MSPVRKNLYQLLSRLLALQEEARSLGIRRLLSAHSRQVWKYVDKYVDGVGVCPGIIYPTALKSFALKQDVEKFFSDHCIQIVWYDDP
jgi:hypothetical protein